ncbi:MAG: oxygen-dependent coproporphyrinogen oxidase, partial [Gammaproteobacteria bacterium]
MQDMTVQAVEIYLRALQDKLTAALEPLDGKEKFKREDWTRAEDDVQGSASAAGSRTPEAAGGGESRMLRHGKLFEQAG